MKKLLRYAARTGLVVAGLFILIWAGVAIYVLVKKPTLLEKARKELKTRVGPQSTLGDLDISFFSHFPHITLSVSKLALRDSLWPMHRHDLLTAEQAYIRMDEWRSILSGSIRIGKVYLQHGSIYLYTDSLGYSNTSAFKSLGNGPNNGAAKGEGIKPPAIELSDMRLAIERQDKRKLFDFDIRNLDCTIDKEARQLSLDIRITTIVKSFAFNMEKGSFIKDKQLQGHFRVDYNTGSRILQFDKVLLTIGGHPFRLSGRFFPDVKPDPFNIDIETENIRWHDATALLTPELQQKLDGYTIERPINVKAVIDAGAADNPKPLLNIRLNTTGNSINTPAGRFDNASFQGSFTNEWIRGQLRNDTNSLIRFTGFTATMDSIPLRADTVSITNLKHPTMSCDLHADFTLAKLNNFSGSNDIRIDKGQCRLDIRYKGPLAGKDSIRASLQGYLDIDSGAITYQPFDLHLRKLEGRIHFDGADVTVQKLQVQTGGTKLQVSGVAHGAAGLLDNLPDSIGMDLRLVTPSLDLEDLHSLAGRPSENAAPKKKGKGILASSGSRLDRMIREGNIHLLIEAVDMRYKKFTGAHARADLLFSGSEIRLKQLQLEQGVGAMTASGSLVRAPGDRNPLSFRCHMESVDVSGLFSEFNNFGQAALRDKNLKGRLTADVTMKGSMSDKGALLPNSLKGSVDFSLKGGQLIDYEPMEKIHQAVLKKRDMSEIRFSEIGSQLDLDTTTFTIHRMEIQSTAFTLYVEGIYDMKTGPDMSLLVPLSNLKERNQDIPPANKGNDSKAGPSLRLRARNGDDGKLKITWDPFKKALKNVKKKGTR